MRTWVARRACVFVAVGFTSCGVASCGVPSLQSTPAADVVKVYGAWFVLRTAPGGVAFA
jgi:hypothetical protein